jgi:hypothetical protein
MTMPVSASLPGAIRRVVPCQPGTPICVVRLARSIAMESASRLAAWASRPSSFSTTSPKRPTTGSSFKPPLPSGPPLKGPWPTGGRSVKLPPSTTSSLPALNAAMA